MFQPAKDNIVLKLTSKYIGNYSKIMKAANLNPANQLNPADLVQIVGEIVALPKEISQSKYGLKGFSLKDISVGDTAIFRFDVVFDLQEAEFSDVPLYKNMIWYKGQEYWLCRIDKLFAIIRKADQSIKMVNGYVMIEDLEEESKIYLPAYQKRISKAREGTLAQIGNTKLGEKMIEAFPGDRVLVHPLKLQHYQIKEKKFAICRQQDVFARILK